jgi:hypothetical protein
LTQESSHPIALTELSENFSWILQTLLTSWDSISIVGSPVPVVLLSCLNYESLADPIPQEVLDKAVASRDQIDATRAQGKRPHLIPHDVMMATNEGFQSEMETGPPTHLELEIALWKLQQNRGWDTRQLLVELNLTPDQAKQVFAQPESDDDYAPRFHQALEALFSSELQASVDAQRVERSERLEERKQIGQAFRCAKITEREFSELMWDGEIEELLIMVDAFSAPLLKHLAELYHRDDLVDALSTFSGWV